MAWDQAYAPEVVGAEAAQAAMENGGTEPAVATAAATAAGEAALARGDTTDQAARQSHDACKLQIYDHNNDMICFLAPAAVIGVRYEMLIILFLRR